MHLDILTEFAIAGCGHFEENRIAFVSQTSRNLSMGSNLLKRVSLLCVKTRTLWGESGCRTTLIRTVAGQATQPQKPRGLFVHTWGPAPATTTSTSIAFCSKSQVNLPGPDTTYIAVEAVVERNHRSIVSTTHLMTTPSSILPHSRGSRHTPCNIRPATRYTQYLEFRQKTR